MLEQWLKRGLAKPGKTQRELARLLGLDPSAVNRMVKGQRQVQVREVATIAAYLEEPAPPGLIEQLAGAQPIVLERPAARPPADQVITARPVELPLLSSMKRDVPVYGVAAGNGDPLGGDFQLETSVVIDFAPRPPGITSTRDAYALYVTGDSMEPKFEHGEMVYVAAQKPVRPGDYVIICLKGRAPGEPERCFIKRLVRRHPDRVDVRQFNPDKVMTFPAAEIVRMHRVLTIADLFGSM